MYETTTQPGAAANKAGPVGSLLTSLEDDVGQKNHNYFGAIMFRSGLG